MPIANIPSFNLRHGDNGGRRGEVTFFISILNFSPHHASIAVETQMTQANSFARYAATRDSEAFAEIVTRYQRLVFATCRRKLRNPADVDDAVQETFLRLAQRAAELHTNPGGWL